MAMRDRERGTVFWSFGYPENIDQTHQLDDLYHWGKMSKTVLYALTMNAVAAALFLLSSIFDDPSMSEWKTQQKLIQESRFVLLGTALYFVANTALFIDFVETTAQASNAVVKVKASPIAVKRVVRRKKSRSKSRTKKD